MTARKERSRGGDPGSVLSPHVLSAADNSSTANGTDHADGEQVDESRRIPLNATKADVELWSFLDSRAVHNDVAEARGYRVVDDLKELTRLGFSRTGSGIYLPAHPVTGGPPTWGQLRPFRPKAKSPKYVNPIGQPTQLDCHPFCLPDLTDGQVDLWVTEGMPKADAAVSVGLCCLSIPGVDNWRNLDHEWNVITLAGRRVVLGFDSDAWTNKNVLRALTAFTEFLVGRGAEVWHVRLPHPADGSKVGIDDFLALGHNAADLLALTEPAEEASIRTEIRKVRIRSEARRRANEAEWDASFRVPPSHEHLGGDFAAPQLPTTWTLEGLHELGMNSLIGAQYKTGKTTLMLNVLQSLVTGGLFLGAAQARPPRGRVGLWNYELSDRQMLRWLGRLRLGAEEQERTALLNLRGWRLPLLVERGEEWGLSQVG